MLSTSAPVGHHLFSASEDDDEDEDDETVVRVRPRTGSLSEHEDILALKAQAQAVIRREEAGYDVSLFDLHLKILLSFPALEPNIQTCHIHFAFLRLWTKC